MTAAQSVYRIPRSYTFTTLAYRPFRPYFEMMANNDWLTQLWRCCDWLLCGKQATSNRSWLSFYLQPEMSSKKKLYTVLFLYTRTVFFVYLFIFTAFCYTFWVARLRKPYKRGTAGHSPFAKRVVTTRLDTVEICTKTTPQSADRGTIISHLSFISFLYSFCFSDIHHFPCSFCVSFVFVLCSFCAPKNQINKPICIFFPSLVYIIYLSYITVTMAPPCVVERTNITIF